MQFLKHESRLMRQIQILHQKVTFTLSCIAKPVNMMEEMSRITITPKIASACISMIGTM